MAFRILFSCPNDPHVLAHRVPRQISMVFSPIFLVIFAMDHWYTETSHMDTFRVVKRTFQKLNAIRDSPSQTHGGAGTHIFNPLGVFPSLVDVFHPTLWEHGSSGVLSAGCMVNTMVALNFGQDSRCCI